MPFAFDIHSTYRNQTIYGVVLSSRPFLSPCDTRKLLRRITDRRGYLNRLKHHVNVKGIYKVSQFSSVFVSQRLFITENVIQRCWKRSDCLLHALLPDVYTLVKISPNLLFRLNSPSSLHLCFCHMLLLLCDLCGSLLDSLHYVCVFHQLKFRVLLTWLASLLENFRSLFQTVSILVICPEKNFNSESQSSERLAKENRGTILN